MLRRPVEPALRSAVAMMNAFPVEGAVARSPSSARRARAASIDLPIAWADHDCLGLHKHVRISSASRYLSSMTSIWQLRNVRSPMFSSPMFIGLRNSRAPCLAELEAAKAAIGCQAQQHEC